MSKLRTTLRIARHDVRALLRDDTGAATAEYAIATMPRHCRVFRPCPPSRSRCTSTWRPLSAPATSPRRRQSSPGLPKGRGPPREIEEQEMTLNTKLYQEAYAQYRADLQQAARWSHADYSHNGITRERARRITEARKKFEAKIPGALDAKTVADHRPKVLEGLAPRNADQVAVIQHDWSTVEAALNSGRPLQQVIVEATSAERLASIAENAEAWAYGQNTNDPAGVAADIRSMVYDRLVAVGYEPAVQANTSHEQFAAHQAWHDVMTEALGSGQTLAAVTDLHESDPDGYRALAVVNATTDPDGEVARTVKHIDALVASGQMKLEG